jgi:pimeloyl-ACP methyl ester carboxylesterase
VSHLTTRIPARSRHRLTALIGLLLACVVAAGCSSGGDASKSPSTGASSGSAASASASSGAHTAPGAGLEPYYSQTVDWASCPGHAGFQCGTVRVPVDYAAPTGDHLELAVVRLKASDSKNRQGSLLVNPGGPGASGVEYAESARDAFTTPLLKNYDIVGFDPRGVGASSPVTCLTDKQLDAYFAADPTPDDATEETSFLDGIHTFDQGCVQRTGSLLPHLSTVDAARDMDVIRAAVGDDQLNYLGASYGTYLGAVYAELFPTKVRRMVLDGALDPTLSAVDLAVGQAAGFQVALDSFVTDCAARSDCPLPKDHAAAIAELGAFLQGLDAKPLKTSDRARPLTEGLAQLGISQALYAPEAYGDFLRKSLAAAFKGNGSGLLVLSDAYSERNDDGTYDNILEANIAINCDDKGSLQTAAQVDAVLPRFEAASPVFGKALAWGTVSCSGWPVAPEASEDPITAAGAPPILVVGTTRDPATPYAWAQSLARQLQSGELLTYDGDGHTAYNRGSTCIDHAVENYLVAGTSPKAGLTCT